MVLQAQGRHDDAIRVFNSLTLKHPASARHWENLGVACRAAKRYDAALVAFARMLALGPPSAVMLYNLGSGTRRDPRSAVRARGALASSFARASRCVDLYGARQVQLRPRRFRSRPQHARAMAGVRAARPRRACRDCLLADPHGSGARGASRNRIARIARSAGTRGAHAGECARASESSHRGPRGAATGTIRREPAGLRPGSVACRGRACAARVEARTGPRFAQGGAQGSSGSSRCGTTCCFRSPSPSTRSAITTARLPR